MAVEITPEIQQLLDQKANATPDEARRIRRQLRALGYSIRAEHGGKPAASVDPTAREKRREKEAHAVMVAPSTPNSYKPTAPMPGDRIQALEEKLRKHWPHISQVSAEPEDEFGYGFQLLSTTSHDQLIEKFEAKWGYPPKWYMLRIPENSQSASGVKLLILGPVHSAMA